jgi:hypothetical protein
MEAGLLPQRGTQPMIAKNQGGSPLCFALRTLRYLTVHKMFTSFCR